MRGLMPNNASADTLTPSKLSLRLPDALLIGLPFLIAFIIMLPRLSSPQFGLLDDGVILRASEAISKDWQIIFRLGGGTGRFFPAYWLIYVLPYSVAGPNPLVFYLETYLVLAIILASLIYIVRASGGSKVQACAVALFFVLSGPVVENTYTLSKPELFQTQWLALSLVLITVYDRAKTPATKIIIVMAVTACLLLADLTKETSLVVIPISVGWLLVQLIWHRTKSTRPSLQSYLAYLFAGLTAGVAFLILRSLYVQVSLAAGTYTNAYSLDGLRILSSGSRWLAWLIRDFPYLIPLTFFVGLSLIRREQRQGQPLFNTWIWMLGWIAIFLPWSSTLEYYLLPFTLGCAIYSGIALGQLISALVYAQDRWIRIAAIGCLFAVLLLVPFTLANNFTNSQLQLKVDAANTQLVDYLATLPPNSVVYVNLPESNEYLYEIGVHLAVLKHRSDIQVNYFRPQALSATLENQLFYVVTPTMVNQLLPSVRIAVDENSAKAWNQLLQRLMGNEARPIYKVENHVPLLDFGFHRLVCAFGRTGRFTGIFCNVPRPFVDSRDFAYGWEVYQILSKANSEFYDTGLYSPIDETHPLQGQSPSSASIVAGSTQARIGVLRARVSALGLYNLAGKEAKP